MSSTSESRPVYVISLRRTCLFSREPGKTAVVGWVGMARMWDGWALNHRFGTWNHFKAASMCFRYSENLSQLRVCPHIPFPLSTPSSKLVVENENILQYCSDGRRHNNILISRTNNSHLTTYQLKTGHLNEAYVQPLITNLATSAAFIAEVAAWPTVQASWGWSRWPIVTFRRGWKERV